MVTVMVNNKPFYFVAYKDAIAHVFNVAVHRSYTDVQPIHALKSNCNEAVEICKEMLFLLRDGKGCKGKEKAALLRISSKLEQSMEYIAKATTIEDAQKAVFAVILELAGHNLLYGFGLVNKPMRGHKPESPRGDAERQSYIKDKL